MTVTDPRQFYQSKYKTIGDIPGIGEATVQILRGMGITTIENLVTIPRKQFIEGGIGEETIDKLQKAARSAISLAFIKGDDLLELRKGE